MSSSRRRCERATAGLADRGFDKERSSPITPLTCRVPVAFLAVASVGGVNSTASPLYTAEELAGQLRDCGARMLVTVPELLEKATVAAARSRVEEIFVYGEGDGATPFASLLEARGEPPGVAIDRPRTSSRCRIRAAPRGCLRG